MLNTYNFRVTPPIFGGVFICPPNHAKNRVADRQKIGVNPPLKYRC